MVSLDNKSESGREAQLQATLNVIPAYTWYADPSGALTFVNERLSDYLGLPKDHPLRSGIATGASWDSHISLLHPDDQEESRRVWSTCLRTASAGEMSFRVRNAEGRYRWFLSRAEPLRASDGTLLYWIGVNLEIENAKRAEQELRDAIDTIPAIVWSTLPDGSNTYVNKRYVEYTGSSAEQVAGSGWQALIHPDDLERHAGKWMEAVATGKPHESEVRSRRSDGQYRWQLDRGAPLRDEDGNIVKWYGVTTDIEDRKRAEEALQESQFYLAEGQRLARMGSWAFNAAGFSYWSSELFRIYGLDPAGKPPTVEEYLALVHPEDRTFMKQGIAKMLDDHLAFDFTKRIVRPDGEIRHVRCVGVPVAQGEIFQGFLGTGMDVTEQERLTEELRLSEHYLSEGQRLAHMGSWVLDPAGSFPYWSHELFHMYGLDPAKEGPSLVEYLALIHPQDREFMRSLIKKMVAEVLGCDVIKRIVRPNGELRYIRCVGTPVVEGGTLQRIIGTAMDVTEHELLTQELRRREAYLTEAQRLSHTGSFGWRPDSGEVVWSDETYRIFECDHAVKPTIDFLVQRVHPENRPNFLKVIESASAGATQFEHTYRLLLPDGSVKHVHALAHSLQDASGNREFVGAATDVTSIKRAEEELRKSEAYLAEAQRLSQTGSWAWSPDQDIRYWSEECYRVLSFDPQDGLPRFEDFFQRIHPDDQPGFRELIQTAISEKAEWEADYRIVHPDGPVRDIHVVGHPVLSASGDLVEFVGTVIDVTERKRAEEELRRSEMELRQILDLVPQLVAVFGPGGERLYANRIGLDYVGRSLEEWRQTPGTFFQSGGFFHPDDRERAARTYSDMARSGGSACELESRLRKGDGTYRWFLVRFNPLRDEQGQITRWYVALTDIEDRKRAEEKLQLENAALREEIDQTSMFEEIVGTSRALQTVLSRISKVAPSDSTVLITGETGTGKELVARAIHRRSQRSGRAFVSVNCAAIPRDLILSELFGHEKGAFTGAMQRRLGRFEMADGGTIFLDEVGELSPDTQVALLRVLQEREFERVGGGQPIRVDVRVIAATNRDLQAAAANGTFRQDLFYRLNVFPIEVPPLRERKDDILMLVEYFAQRYATRAGKNVRLIEKKTLEQLQSYAWPGNIRELQNVIERSVILSAGEALSVDEMWLSKEISRPTSRVEESPRLNRDAEPRSEREIIEATLTETRGRVSGPSGAAARLKIPASTLNNRIKSLKIDKKQFKFR
jgi:PAS domain S-box-containing protein